MSSTPNKVLTALADANEYVALGMNVAGVFVPLVKGAIKAIRAIGAPQDTVAYEVLLQVDGADLDDVAKLAAADLLAINAELAARGVPEVPVSPAPPTTTAPGTTASGPAADPAPGTAKP